MRSEIFAAAAHTSSALGVELLASGSTACPPSSFLPPASLLPPPPSSLNHLHHSLPPASLLPPLTIQPPLPPPRSLHPAPLLPLFTLHLHPSSCGGLQQSAARPVGVWLCRSTPHPQPISPCRLVAPWMLVSASRVEQCLADSNLWTRSVSPGKGIILPLGLSLQPQLR